MDELWLPVLGYEDSYEVSNRGRVRSIERIVIRKNGSPMPYKSQIISQFRSPPTNYLTVSLKRCGQKINRRVHVLVAEAFICPRPDGLVVCHGRLGMDVNTPENMRWGTQFENLQDRYRVHGHHHANKTHCKRGHEFTPVNTYINPTSGGRQCRACLKLGATRRNLQGQP